MSTISASTTSTTAYKVTADTTGTLVLQTGSTPTTAVTIDTSQNVGIGTSSPAAKLQIGTGNIRLSDGYQIEWGGGTNSIEGSNASNYLRFWTNNTVRMVINSSGNVGINTTPSYGKLDVNGDSAILASNRQLFYNATNGNYAAIKNSSTGTGTTMLLQTNVDAVSIDATGSMYMGGVSARSGTADGSSYPRLVVGASGGTSGSTVSGFGEFYYASQNGSMSFKIINGSMYLVAVWSSTSSASSNPVLYLIFGLNKGGGSNPTVQKIGGAAETWSFSYAQYSTYDTTVTITDGGYNQGTRAVVMQLGSQ